MSKQGIERRKSARKQVLETFHVFLVIPKIGLRKLYLKDVSEGGLAFLAEPGDHFGTLDTVNCYFHINPNLRLPLSFKVAHTTELPEGKQVGCEFTDTSSKAFKAYTKFLALLDDLAVFLDQ